MYCSAADVPDAIPGVTARTAESNPQDLRRLSLSGTVPAELPLEPSESTWGDVEPDDAWCYASKRQSASFRPADNKVQTWIRIGEARSGRRLMPSFAILRAPREPGDTEAGVWLMI